MAEVKKYIIEEADLINIADSVRAKRGTTAKMDVKTIPQEILNIETLIPEGYLKPEGTQSITKNGTYDIGEYANVNVNVPIPEGYLDPEGTQEITANGGYNVELLEWVDVNVPIPEGYIIPAGKINISDMNEVDVTDYATAQIVDSNLIAENIAENVEVLGITGTFKGRIDTSDATATSDDMLLGKTAYVNDNKVVGNIETWDGTFEGDVELYRPFNEYIGGIKTDITKKDLEGINRIRDHCFYYQPITSIDIPQNITSIGMHAFSGTESLKNVIVPDSVTSIGDRAFYSSGIVTIVLSNNLSQVPAYLVRQCQSLTSITFGRGTTSIAGSALNVTPSLKEIICLAETPPSLSSEFSTNEDCVIKVPANSVEAYKSATNWSVRADYIVAYEEEE